MKNKKLKIKIAVRIFIATILIIIGVLGIILPFLHGIAFLLAGFIILSVDFPYVEKKLEKFVAKHAKIEKMYKKIKNIIKKHL